MSLIVPTGWPKQQQHHQHWQQQDVDNSGLQCDVAQV